MNSKIREIIFGDGDIKEYATITTSDGIRERVHLKIGTTTLDISQRQWLLCLEPIVFGVWIENKENKTSFDERGDYKMCFTAPAAHGNVKSGGSVVANLKLDFFDKIVEQDGLLLLLKLKESRIHHINFMAAHLLFVKYYKKPGLSFTKLKFFASAYSYPRRVRIIGFKQGDYYNIFPMDLLGDIAAGNKFVFGLRHTNIALAKIIESKKLVVCEVSCAYKDIIYRLGSHHSSAAPAVEQLPFKVINTRNFGFYVPEWVDSYKEIDIIKTVNLGSHMLLWGEVKDKCELKSPGQNLYHIHYLLYLYYKRKHLAYSLV